MATIKLFVKEKGMIGSSIMMRQLKKKTIYELNHSSYKRQVIFLLYAEKSYYNGAMECGADF